MSVSFSSSIRYLRGAASRRARRSRFVPNLDVLELRLAPSATYYVSPNGSDSNNGLSEATAWRTLNRVNLYGPRAGDTILLEGGQTHYGTLDIWRGDPGNTLTVDSYGGDRATIYSGDSPAIRAGTPGGLHIRNLSLVGSGADVNDWVGLEMANDGLGHASNIYLENLEVTGYGTYGIYIWADAHGLSDLTLRNIDTHHNGNGAYIGGGRARTFTNVHLSEVRAFNNDRVAPVSVAGLGVELEGVTNLVVERSVFAYNGNRGGPAGDAGLLISNAGYVLVEYNEAYGNMDGAYGDGHGIYLAEVDDTLVQFNYMHDNGGPGLAHSELYPQVTSHRNTFRYNVMQNNVAGLQLTGYAYDTEVYNNTIFSDSGDTGFQANVILSNWTGANANFRNNIFLTARHAPQILVDDDSMPSSWSLTFQGNVYYNLTRPESTYIIIGSEGFYTLDEFRAWTGQEMLFGVLPVGYQIDPQLLNPGGGQTFGDPEMLGYLTDYYLGGDSPLRTLGLDLFGLFGIYPGDRDFYGYGLPEGFGFSVGAYQGDPLDDLGITGGQSGSGSPLIDPLSLLDALEEAPAVGDLGELAGVDWAEIAPESYSWELAFQATRLLTESADPVLDLAWAASQDWANGLEYPLFELPLLA